MSLTEAGALTWAISPPQGHWAKSGDVWGYHDWEVGVARGINSGWDLARLLNPHSSQDGPPMKNDLAPDVSSAEAEEPFSVVSLPHRYMHQTVPNHVPPAKRIHSLAVEWPSIFAAKISPKPG